MGILNLQGILETVLDRRIKREPLGQTFQYVLNCEGVSIFVADYSYHTNGVFKLGDEVRWSMVEESLRLIPKEETGA